MPLYDGDRPLKLRLAVPELPEVETVRRGLNQVTLHQPLIGSDVLLERTVASPTVDAFLEGLRGTAIAQWHRRGKYLLAELVTAPTKLPQGIPQALEPAGYLGVHLRMTGQLLWLHQDEPLQKHTRVRLLFGDGRELRFVDQRTFGQMWWIPPHQSPEMVMSGLQRLGPEPFSDAFSVEYLRQRLTNRDRPIKNSLLDQEIIAGVGNIYADEALFLSGLRPQKLSSQLKPRQVERLHGAIVQVLQQAIAANGTTFSDFRDVHGTNGNYGGVAWVYDREGQPCRTCGNAIERIKLAGRSAHFCKKCQR